jgi:hypothetical protein
MRTLTETTIHNCRGFKVARWYPDIHNMITLAVMTDNGQLELRLFDLPRSVACSLIALFSDEDTQIVHGEHADPVPLATVIDMINKEPDEGGGNVAA